MSLSDDLLQQLVDDVGELKQSIGQHGQAIESLRAELIGASGRNGRIGRIEADIEDFKATHNKFLGARAIVHWIITVGAAIATSFGYHHVRH